MSPPTEPNHATDRTNVVWESRPHPVTMGAWLPIGLGLVLLGLLIVGWSSTDGGVFLTIGMGVVLVGLVMTLTRYLVWTNTRYVITDDELYKEKGIVSRNVTQFRLDRIQNTSLQQGAIGRLLGYGELTVFTAGSGDPELTLERIPRPQDANSVLNQQLEGGPVI
ncbi:PH domain-containing protein [Halobacteria archaeon AArc-dxtr1]|nr:PH domain-containing protein [Halobacteria archaeon AArc-dxtr1]